MKEVIGTSQNRAIWVNTAKKLKGYYFKKLIKNDRTRTKLVNQRVEKWAFLIKWPNSIQYTNKNPLILSHKIILHVLHAPRRTYNVVILHKTIMVPHLKMAFATVIHV